MTPEELNKIEKEIKEYVKKFKPDEGYVFISYAHRDSETVYPKVLEWMREGYNIYIDMDFENHGSEANWVDQMRIHIRKRDCKLAVCFASVNYTFSYASFIELLTIKSKNTFRKRNKELPLDIIAMDSVWDNTDVSANFKKNKEMYQKAFEKMKAKMGDSFLANNKGERELFEEGILSWKGENEKITKEIIENFDANYKDGANDFYSCLGETMNEWIKEVQVNGNHLKLDCDMEERFKNSEVYKRETGNISKPTVDEKTKTAAPIIQKPTPDDSPVSTSPVSQEPTSGEEPTSENLMYFMGATAEIVSDKQIVLKSGSLVNKNTSDSCPDKTRRLREEAVSAGKLVENGLDYRLTEDITFKSLGLAAAFVGGYPITGSAAWKTKNKHKTKNESKIKKETETKNETKPKQTPTSKVSSQVSPQKSNQGLSAGAVLYVKDHPQEEAQLLENGDVHYAGRDISLNQFVQLVLGPGSRNAYLYVVEKNTGKLLKELMNDNGGEPEREKEPDSKESMEAKPVILSGKDVTIQDVREMCLSPVTLLDFKEVRNNMPRGGMSAMDYAMTAILGGCNQVTMKSPAYQINYYSYVISKIEDSSKKNDGGLGATWTWSSNCRKALGLEKSGGIPKEINDYFAGLDSSTTLDELETKFREGTEEPFSTKKNDLVILAIQNIRKFMNR